MQAPAQRAATMGAFKHSYPAPTIIKAKQQQSATVIVMHGLGDTAAGWAPVGQQLAGLLPHVKWVFPTAPTVRSCPAVMRAAVDTTATKRLSEVTLSLTTKGNLALGWSAKQQWRRNRLRIAFQVATKNVLITTHGLGHVLPCSATHAYDTMSEVHGQGHPGSALQVCFDETASCSVPKHDSSVCAEAHQCEHGHADARLVRHPRPRL